MLRVKNKLWTGRRLVAVRSRRGPQLVADRSPTSRRLVDSDSHALILTKLVGDWSRTGLQLCRDLSATKTVAARFLNMFKNLATTDLVAARSRTSRRLLCNLAGTDRGPCCVLCDCWKLSVAEWSQSGCNVCLTGALQLTWTEGLNEPNLFQWF